MSDTPDTASFNKNYKVLKDTADWLSQQKEPDIDQLVPKVESAMQAYKVCKTRLDAVQATFRNISRRMALSLSIRGRTEMGSREGRCLPLTRRTRMAAIFLSNVLARPAGNTPPADTLPSRPLPPT